MTATRRVVSVGAADIEIFIGESAADRPIVAAAHTSDRLSDSAIALLADATASPESPGAPASTGTIVCINPWGLNAIDPPSLETMVDRIDVVRRALDLPRWIFWGMSGGGWLAQIYAHRHPDALSGIVIEGACLSFRDRLADPACVLSPLFPAWREPLSVAGFVAESRRDRTFEGEWTAVEGIGDVFRDSSGAALMVAPGSLAPEMRRVMPRLWTFDSRAWIGRVRVPALVIGGAADLVAPIAHVRAVHEALPGSTFVEIDGAGHIPSVEKRPEVARAFQEWRTALA